MADITNPAADLLHGGADDAAWFDLVAGRAASGADALTRAEAALFRAAVLTARTSTEGASRANPIDIDALIPRARAAGILAPRRRPFGLRWLDAVGTTDSPAPARRRIAIVAVCASVGAGLVGLRTLLSPMHDLDTDVERGPTDRPFVLHEADPAALKQRLIDDLAEAGVKPQGYVRFGRHGIEADIGTPPDARVQRVLRKYAIPVPADGVLRVEIEAPAP